MKFVHSYKKLVFCLFLTNQYLAAPVVDPNAPIQFRPSVLTLPNKVTVLNIPTSNSSGLSHLRFKGFSVLADESLVWNNSTTAGSSVLADLLDPK